MLFITDANKRALHNAIHTESGIWLTDTGDTAADADSASTRCFTAYALAQNIILLHVVRLWLRGRTNF